MISYDESKRQLNLRKHGIDFVGCDVIFEEFTLTREDERENYGELRFQTNLRVMARCGGVCRTHTTR